MHMDARNVTEALTTGRAVGVQADPAEAESEERRRRELLPRVRGDRHSPRGATR